MKIILIIEDKLSSSKRLKNILLLLKHEVAGIFTPGRETEKKLIESSPDLMVVYNKSGKAMKWLNSNGAKNKLNNIPVILLEEGTEKLKSISQYRYLTIVNNPGGSTEEELKLILGNAISKSYLEIKLIESNERYRTLFEESSDLIFVHDEDGNLSDANPLALKVFGIIKSEINSFNLFDIIAPAQKSWFKKILNDLKNGTVIKSFVKLSLNKRSENIAASGMHISYRLLGGLSGSILGIGKVIDKDDRENDASQKIDNKFSTLIKQMDEGVTEVDKDGKIIFANKKFCSMVGYQESELIGKYAYKLFASAKDRQLVLGKSQERSEKKPGNYELQYRKKNGELFWTEVKTVPLLDNKSNPIGLFVIHKDIIEREISESAVSHFAAIVESSQDTILSKTLDGIITSWNKGAEKMYGYTAKEVIGKRANILAPDEYRSEYKTIVSSIKNGKQISDFETVRLKKDGTRFNVLLTASPVINSRGEITGVLTMTRDITKHKEATESLQLSEKKYRDIFEFAPIGIFQADASGKILTTNITLSQMLGYGSPDKLINLNFADNIFLEKDQFLSIADFTSSTNSAFDCEVQWKRKNGKLIWVQLNAHCIKNNKGKIIYYEGFARDITKHRHDKEVLAEHEHGYKSLIDTSQDAIYVMQNRRLVLVNPAWEKLFGYSFEEATGKNFNIMKIVAEESVDFINKRFKNLHNKLKDNRVPSRYEMTGKTKDGRLLQLEVSASAINWKGKKAVQGLYRDITSQKKYQEQIRMLSLGIEQSPASIIITDTSGKIEYVNQKFSQTTGYNREEILEKKPNILSTDKFTSEIRQNLLATIHSGKIWRGEFLNKKKNGELYWESAYISPIMDNKGKITHFLSVQEDITFRKEHEKELIQAKESAEKSDMLKTEFLAQMSHEIRTPLNNILTYTSVLKEEFEDKLPEGLESTFQVIDNSSQRLIRTIELILNLSRIQTGNYDMKLEKFDIDKDLLEDIMLEFFSRAKMKDLNLLFENMAERSKVKADKYSLGQVFINLIENAIKYTRKGSIKIKIYNDKENVCVDVGDTGIGISSEYIPQLFNPFTQEDIGITRHYEGIGLGLALVKNYAALNNATVSVKSKKGKGSTFTISLPIAG